MTMAAANSNGVIEAAFPTGSLVPKTETAVLSFLQKYPEYDGRDVVIAIFDSGVDPRAAGLETLCDGKTVKVIERFDCTGCGDVDTTKKVTADENGYITGLSGRKLKLTPQMTAANTANGEYRLGLKTFHDLCPSKVRENITNYTKTKEWDEHNKTSIAAVARKISQFEAENGDSSKLEYPKKLIKENLDNTLEMLNFYEKVYKDVKTTYDCVLYQTENGWQAVFDITEKGDLENALHIGEYTKTHEMKNVDDYFSISINVHDNGDVLEVVGLCSSHGTHVASIACGNQTSKDIDGVAPNAKIISLTIGDGRLGSMETGTALVRAMMKVMEMCRAGTQVDVINMSYGEHGHWSNAGRIGELMNEVVNKYGVVWVASAGNNGPALCTIGTPPDISQPNCIGVGAYVSPQMMEAEYVMREKLPANVYTWTSRDPCIDGGQGVTICAPGGAITSVPQCTMSKSQLMNGTSMAAPHVAGAIALLISGLKQKGIPYSPYSIKRAVSNTATKLSYVDPFAQGNGLLNIEKAFEYLEQHKNAAETMIRFSVRCGSNNNKGILLREGALQKPYEYNVYIEPVFLNDQETEPREKFNFNVRLTLVCSQPFVQCGTFLDLSYGSRQIVVKVDPTGLPPGVHSATISAFDSDCVQKGALFQIPVTIMQPHTINCSEKRIFEPVSNRNDGSIEFQPNTTQRDIILVPNGATWAVLRVRSTDQNRGKDTGKFFVHTMQILPKFSCRIMENLRILPVSSETDSTLLFKCQENNILELCISKYWSNYGATHIKYHVEFHGIKAVNANPYVMQAARGIHKLDLVSCNIEEIQPQIQLKFAAVILKPSESKIMPLSATRDVIPDGRQIYQNLLTYSLQIPKVMELTLHAPIFNSMLYESEFESQFWMLFDTNKALIACGDAHSHKFHSKLDKGDYTVKLQVRHEKRDLLEKISEATMIAHFKLPNTISLELYDHYNNCIIGQRKFGSGILKENPPTVMYVAPLTQEKLSKASLPPNCAWLNGTIAVAKDETARRVDVQEFTYILNPPEKKNGNGNNSSVNGTISSIVNSSKSKTSTVSNSTNSENTTPPASGNMAAASGDGTATSANSLATKNNSEYAELLREFQCVMIGKCDLEKAKSIYEEVIAAHPQHLVAHTLLIQAIESHEVKLPQLPIAFVKAAKFENTEEDKQKDEIQKIRTALKRIVELAELALKDIDAESMLSYYGMKIDARPDANKHKTNMDKQKTTYLEALTKKGIALGKLGVINNDLKERTAALDTIFFEILKYVDSTDPKVNQFALWHAYCHGHYGRMYKILSKMYEEKRTRDIQEELYQVAVALKYTHLQTLLQRLTISLFPNDFRVF